LLISPDCPALRRSEQDIAPDIELLLAGNARIEELTRPEQPPA
jgi:hypothetical protein